MTPRLIAFALLAGAACLAGCGRTGDLERPAPMFGGQPQAAQDDRPAMTAEARARADAARSDPDAETPQSVQELRRMQGAPAPSRADPIPGANPDPNGAPPQGAIPDPYNYPQSGPG
jgi:putative lipoprotein